MTRPRPRPVVVFDVVETLLDLRALDPWFVAVFGDAGARSQWFARVLKTALTTTVTGPYRAFPDIGRAALEMTGELRGVRVTEGHAEELRGALAKLPAHPDVLGALETLRDAGFRLATLSNTPLEGSRKQLENAGLSALFGAVLSADEVQRLKPAPEPYRHAAQRLGVSTRELLMVAAHSWDVEGAARAGCRTAFVERDGHVLSPLAPTPDLRGENLGAIASEACGNERFCTFH